MNYFLAKTDPDTYSIDDLAQEKETVWDGVHNHQAIAVIKKMQIGDRIYVYHSQSDKCIVGLMEVASDPYENKNDSRFSWAVPVRFIKKYTQTVSLADFKSSGLFSDFVLIRNSRLSTMEVPAIVQKWIEERVQ